MTESSIKSKWRNRKGNRRTTQSNEEKTGGGAKVVKATKQRLRKLYPEEQVVLSETMMEELKVVISSSIYTGDHVITEAGGAIIRAESKSAFAPIEEDESYAEFTIFDETTLIEEEIVEEEEYGDYEEESYLEFTVMEEDDENDEKSYVEYTVVDEDEHANNFNVKAVPTEVSPKNVQTFPLPEHPYHHRDSKLMEIIVPNLDDDDVTQITMHPFEEMPSRKYSIASKRSKGKKSIYGGLYDLGEEDEDTRTTEEMTHTTTSSNDELRRQLAELKEENELMHQLELAKEEARRLKQVKAENERLEEMRLLKAENKRLKEIEAAKREAAAAAAAASSQDSSKTSERKTKKKSSKKSKKSKTIEGDGCTLYAATIPKGVRPGQTFRVAINGKEYTVTCPRNTRAGQTIHIPIKTEQTKRTLYAVTVPKGVGPNQTFKVKVNGKKHVVECPPNARAGQTVHVPL